jgi:hypothetical protein
MMECVPVWEIRRTGNQISKIDFTQMAGDTIVMQILPSPSCEIQSHHPIINDRIPNCPQLGDTYILYLAQIKK